MRRSVAALACLLVIAACTTEPPAQLGGPCKEAEKEACGAGDALVCRSGTWQEWGSGCRPACVKTTLRYGKTFALCRGRAHAGGPCPKEREGLQRCADDGTARVVCRAGRWQKERECACSDRLEDKKLWIKCAGESETLAE